MESERSQMEERAWTLLGTAFMAQRAVWLAAAQVEGLTPPQAMVLMKLDADAPPSLGDLARFVRCDASQMTSTADRLEERGFALRRVSPTDRRVKELTVTEAGRAAQQRLRAAFTRPPDTLRDLPDDELAALVRAAEWLAAGAGPEMRQLFGSPPVTGA